MGRANVKSTTLARDVRLAVYTEDMFRTTHDAANREAVKAVTRPDLNLVGIAMRAERKVIDKIVDGLKFHSYYQMSELLTQNQYLMISFDND